MTMSSSPGLIPISPAATSGLTSSHTSGAPSAPCFGASRRTEMSERITPIDHNVPAAACAAFMVMTMSLPEIGGDALSRFAEEPERCDAGRKHIYACSHSDESAQWIGGVLEAAEARVVAPGLLNELELTLQAGVHAEEMHPARLAIVLEV